VGSGITGGFFDAVGSEDTARYQVHSAVPTSLSVAHRQYGNYVVVWSTDRGGVASEDVFLRYALKDAVATVHRVNKTTEGDQNNVDIGMLASHGMVVSWDDSALDGDGSGIYMRVYGANGRSTKREIRVNDTTAGDQTDSAVAGLADGGFVVTWTSEGQDGRASGIYQKVFNADGSTRLSEVHVGGGDEQDQRASAVTALEDGGWVVTWQAVASGGGVSKVHQQRYNPDGSTAGDRLVFSEGGTSVEELHPAVIALADGGWATAYSTAADGDDQVYQIALVIRDADGVEVDRPETGMADGGRHDFVDLSRLKNGSLAAVWQSTSVAGSPSDLGVNHRVYSYVEDSILRDDGRGRVTGTDERDVIKGFGGDDRLRGRGGADAVSGGSGADLVVGGAGNDRLIGGSESDVFEFSSGFGRDVIMDFSPSGPDHDVVDLSGVSSIKSYDDLTTSHMTQLGADILIKAGANDWLVISGVRLGNLSASDFAF
jgi:Ca2+-binding RTX toxin-like protein